MPLAFANSTFDFDPARGCAWNALTLDGWQVMQPNADPAAYHGSLLFPWPNRLAGGHFSIDDHKQFRLFMPPVNDPETNSALHGLAANLPFEVIDQQTTTLEDYVRLSATFEGQARVFPWRAALTVAFSLSASGLACTLTVRALPPLPEAEGLPMPFGVGWHPYFTLGGTVDDWLLQLPDMRQIQTDKNMIPSGKLLPYADFGRPLPVGAAKIDVGLQLVEGAQLLVGLTAPAAPHRLEVWGQAGFGYLQLYTPPSRQSLAIEPMSCAADAFHNGLGLQHLPVGEERSFVCGVRRVAG